MQLGICWRAGERPHRSLPSQFHGAVSLAEGEYPEGSFWTLTWLEGRPRCSLDELLVLTLGSDGVVVCERGFGSLLPGVRVENDLGDIDDW